MVLINQIIGSFRKYQWWICFILFITKFGVAFHQMAIIFLAPPVMYKCPGQKDLCCDKPEYNTTVFKRTIITEWHLICDKSWLKDFTQTLFQFGVLTGSLLFGMASDRLVNIYLCYNSLEEWPVYNYRLDYGWNYGSIYANT